MRAARFFVSISLTAGLVAIVACQEPTQVTVDVRLATAKCQEIHGTAINVGVRPTDTEEKVKSKFPNAQTTDCDDGAGRIGTLVITPSDEERGSVIVITSYGKQRDPTECQPPSYTDCIVARRQFSFIKHRRLTLPMTIDPTCVNVPCDAFSTCRNGFCFPSDAPTCDGNDCLEPGATADGGTDPTTAVDGSSPDAIASLDSGPPTDSSTDGPLGDGDAATLVDGDATPDTGTDAPIGMSCDGNNFIVCPPVVASCTNSGANACCGDLADTKTCVAVGGGSCPGGKNRWCCRDEDCGGGVLKCPLGTGPRMCCSMTGIEAGGGQFSPFGVTPMCN